MFTLSSESMAYAEHLFSLLEAEWKDGHGMNRLGYTAEETRAVDAMIAEGNALGLTIRQDAVGNVFMVLPGKKPERGAILSGSHLDSVVSGGRYDGPAGVIAAMVVAKTLKDANIQPDHDFVVGIYRNEESPAFKQVSVGAKIALGEIDPSDFMDRKHTITGRPFRDHLIECGLSPERLTHTFNRHGLLIPPSSFVATVEVHIEQEGELRDNGLGVGVVTAIRGNGRYPNIRIDGVTGHSGAKSFAKRQDAAIALVRLVGSMHSFCASLNEEGYDAVFTAPHMAAGSPNKLTHIPDLAIAAMEFRSVNPLILADFTERITDVSQDLEKEQKVKINLGPSVYSDPAIMSTNIIEALRAAAQNQYIPHMLMPSGAGHDTAVFAKAEIPSSMLFVAQKSGVSHCPEEDMGRDPEMTFSMKGDYAQAIRMLGDFAYNGLPTNAQHRTPFIAAFDQMYALS